MGWCCARFLLDGSILWAAQNRWGVWERRNWPRNATGRWAALPGGAGGRVSVGVFLPAKRVYPAGAVSGGEGGQGQRWQPHVLPWGDQLSKSFLMGEGVAWPPWTAASAQTALRHTARPTPGAYATTDRLSLLLPHQLSVAHLDEEQRRGRGTWDSVMRFSGMSQLLVHHSSSIWTSASGWTGQFLYNINKKWKADDAKIHSW